MRTADLIKLLAGEVRPVDAFALLYRLVAATAFGVAIAILALALWLGMRPLAAALAAPSFWMKAGYTSALALGGLILLWRLARPGADLGRMALVLIAAAVAVMAAMGSMQLMHAPSGGRVGLWLGGTWRECSLRIVMLAAPIYAATIVALQSCAPTRPLVTGAVAGLASGALGATVYGLYCQESAAAFVAFWYTLGVALSAALGAIVGSRLLRW